MLPTANCATFVLPQDATSFGVRSWRTIGAVNEPVVEDVGVKEYNSPVGKYTRGVNTMKPFLTLLGIAILSSSLQAAVAEGENLLINGRFDAEQVDFPESSFAPSPQRRSSPSTTKRRFPARNS